jgi:hypothetical protein
VSGHQSSFGIRLRADNEKGSSKNYYYYYYFWVSYVQQKIKIKL